MKKIKILLIAICLLSLCALVLTSCGSKLSTPRGLYLDEDTQTLKWNKVRGAHGYTIEISGIENEIVTQANYISLEKLEPGEYDIRVWANGDGKSSRNSSQAKYSFTREAESGLKYQLINNGTEYALIGGGSASGDVVMEDVYRGKPVTAIAEKALYHNAKISSFTIGKNVKTIGDKAFTKCSKLTEITVPDNVIDIGEYAFQSCKALVKATLPDTVTVIKPYTFAWCSELKEVKVGSELALIGEFAFSNCESLTTINHAGTSEEGKIRLPDTMLQISTYAFADCISITDADLGSGIQIIDTYAFTGNTSLANIDLGESLVAIMEAAFYGCTSLSEVAIPDSCEMLGNGVFYGCTVLESLSFGTGLKAVGSQLLTNTAILASAENMLIIDGWLIQVIQQSIKGINLDNQIVGIAAYALVGCNELETALFKGVKYVGAAAFASCQSLYKVSFDDALLEIGDNAFAGSTVSNLTLGNSLTYIGNYAFNGCKLLTKDTLKNVTLPESLTYIGMRAFYNTGLYSTSSPGSVVYVGNWVVDYVESQAAPSIAIKEGTRGIAAYTFSNQELVLASMPNTVEYICRGAFYKCTARLISLSSALKVIDDYAFYGCEGANFGNEDFALIIPEGTQYIGRSAFYQCKYILSLVIPGTVEYIGPYAFYDCDSIGATAEIQVQKPTGEKDENGDEIIETVINKVTGFLQLNEGIKVIDERAFQKCVSLISVDIPDSVIYIGARAFYKCDKLESVSLGSGITSISDYTFYKCISLKTVSASDSLKSVGNYAFRGCSALESFDFGSIEQIGRYAFYSCSSLEDIVLPATLVSVGDYAFRGCDAAGSIILRDSIVNIGKHAFYNLSTTTIYSSAETINPYWNERFNSSYRPIFWGCTLSEDGSYVVSIKVSEDTLDNPNAKNGISDPSRSGYTFLGWSTSSGDNTVEYTSENVAEAPEGTVLYSVWSEISESNE